MRAGRLLPVIAAGVLALAVIAVWAVVAAEGGPGLMLILTGRTWAPPLLLSVASPALGSLITVAGGLLFGAGGGYLAASYLVYERPWARRALLALFDAGAWIPTVVLGLLGVTWLVPAMHAVDPSGYGLLPALLLLAAFAFWPATGRYAAALERLPPSLLEAGLALGGREGPVRRSLTPAALRRPLWAHTVALGGRLAGEATAVALVIGNSGIFPPSLVRPSDTVPSVLLTEAVGAPGGGPWHRAIWAMALGLLLLTALIQVLLRRWAEG